MKSLFIGAFATIIFCSASLADITLSGTQLLRSYEIDDNALRERPTGRAGLTSYRYLSEVGGVNFELHATLPPEISQGLLSIEYDSGRPDGRRAYIRTRTEEFSIPMHDWVLVPTANYANSEYSAVVSLLGGEGSFLSFHARYHPALEETLLGLRMLQADLLPLDLSAARDLPKLDGQTVFGPGESRRLPATIQRAIRAASAIELRLKASDPYPDSWILTDVGSAVAVMTRLEAGLIVAEPKIHYHFWTCISRERCEQTGKVDVLGDLNEVLTETPWQDLNPLVWDAAENLSGYSAVFRTLKSEFPQEWNSFLESLPSVTSPVIETPNVIPKGFN